MSRLRSWLSRPAVLAIVLLILGLQFAALPNGKLRHSVVMRTLAGPTKDTGHPHNMYIQVYSSSVTGDSIPVYLGPAPLPEDEWTWAAEVVITGWRQEAGLLWPTRRTSDVWCRHPPESARVRRNLIAQLLMREQPQQVIHWDADMWQSLEQGKPVSRALLSGHFYNTLLLLNAALLLVSAGLWVSDYRSREG